jgi:hypothetical protein
MAAAKIRTAAQHFAQPAAWAESQFPVAVPSEVHSTRFAPAPTAGQAGVPQAPVAQVRSHLQASSQDTVSHALVPVHVMAHVEPAGQVTSLHALPPVQLIVQVHPSGQSTLPHRSALVQSTVHVIAARSHEVQSPGQSTTTQ